MKKIISLLLITLLLIVQFTSIFADTVDDGKFHISSINDWNRLAKECELDSYSNKLVVELDSDLEFNDNFNNIPYFNGTFNGNHHTIKGINIESSLTNDGVFRITGEKANINNLTVNFNATHDGNHFGFVGYNQGKLSNIYINASIKANNNAGMIAGYNCVTGVIENSSTSGSISGKHYVGGLVGQNYGAVLTSYNYSLINTEIVKEDLDISTLTLESITSSDSISKLSDIGGIVGGNLGTIENCVNSGEVGHDSIGYNIGGIAGSQAGYLSNCTNKANIKGRKEVGGIVGQMEPAMSLIFKEDYLQKMKKQLKTMSNDTISFADELRSINDKSVDCLDDAIDAISEAYDAIETLIGNDDVGDIAKGKTALSAAVGKIISCLKSLNDNFENYDSSYEKLKIIANEARDFGSTAIDFSESLNVEKDVYKDVSNKDNDKNKTGKVKACYNYGTVDGDINVGGITGSMAVENDLNPEDDFDIIGAKSFDMSYEIKDILDSSYNYGMIFVKRNNAGGICGSQNLGLIKNCINYGMLKCEEGNYIGGIVGKSTALLNSNYAKCFIYGNNYVGGIAGSATKGEKNGSIVQILTYNSNAGSIFGNYGNINNEVVDKVDDIKNNWYVYDGLAAIDGISYAKKAFMITDEEMLSKKIDDELKRVNIIFMDENEILYKKTVEYGESINESDVPDDVIYTNEYRSWNDYDKNKLNNISKDLLFVCDYVDIYPSISSSETPLASVVANGKFIENDEVRVNKIDDKPSDEYLNYVTYEIEIDYSDRSEINSFALFKNGYKKYKVFIKENDKWKEINCNEDGSYIVIDNPNIKIVSIVELEDKTTLVIGLCVGVVIFGLILFIGKKIKEKKKTSKVA